MAAHNWRSLRVRAADNGIADLMECSTMHVVLDLIEQVGLESATAGSKTSTQAKSAISAYFDRLYKPDPITQKINGDGYLPPPPGFSDEEVEASFEAFMSSGVH